MSDTDYVPPEDLDDDELYEEYQRAKEGKRTQLRLDELQLEVAQRWEDEQRDVLVTRGYVEWNASVPDEFLDLFIETVEQSEFMSTKWQPNPDTGHDILLIQEVK